MQENKLTKEDVLQIMKDYLKSGAFTDRKLSDTPTDNLQVVPRKYVTRYSSTTLRPTSSVLGEFYFDTTVNRTVTWNGTFYQDPSGGVVS